MLNQVFLLPFANSGETGVVLAISARLLAKNTLPIDLFLDEFQTVQILAWKSTLELPISRKDYNKISGHFEAEGRLDRIGFDCPVSDSSCVFFQMSALV